jgi:hypothetical protein
MDRIDVARKLGESENVLIGDLLGVARIHADREILETVTMAEAGAAVSIARHVLFLLPDGREAK